MAESGGTVWAAGFWADGFWATDFWAGGVAPPVVTTSSGGGGGGGRRRWEDVLPDRKPQREPVKTRPLTRSEIRALDSLFREHGKPTVQLPLAVRSKPAVRDAVRAAIALPDPPAPPPADIQHAPLLRLVAPDSGPVQSLQSVLAQQQREAIARVLAEIAAAQQAEGIAAEHAQAVALEAQRVEAERLEAERIAAEESEMIDVLLMVHEGEL